MTEKLDYTYGQLLEYAIDYMGTMYKNIDSLKGGLNTTSVGDKQQYFSWVSKVNQYNTNTTQGTNASNKGQSGPQPPKNGVGKSMNVVMKWTRSLSSNPAVVQSSDLKTVLGNAVKEVCDVTDLETTVNAKGLLAFLQFLSWFISKVTVFIQPSVTGADALPCIVMISNWNEYEGPSNKTQVKGEVRDKIKAEDFSALVTNISDVASTHEYLLDPIEYSFDFSSCCSSSSSSCSSSSCSSSSSSSSSCSSSSSSCSSSFFVAYMKLA